MPKQKTKVPTLKFPDRNLVLEFRKTRLLVKSADGEDPWLLAAIPYSKVRTLIASTEGPTYREQEQVLEDAVRAAKDALDDFQSNGVEPPFRRLDGEGDIYSVDILGAGDAPDDGLAVGCKTFDAADLKKIARLIPKKG